ncbi:MAG: cold shock domain-containing protein [Acinetobacter sp.]|jgi:cold shock CspA family protein|nr:MAG: cold shock domain-containing protein [Acinetobacter sp.]
MKNEFHQGKIKQYDATKGFGFIGGLEQDIFFHISDFPLAEGEPQRHERVKFVIATNHGKLKAIKIERVKDQSEKAKKTRAVQNNQSITSALLNNFRK